MFPFDVLRPTKKKIFILGVGAQRTGSTWLHSQLNKNKQINMGFCKEYHVFDVLFTPYMDSYRQDLLEKVRNKNVHSKPSDPGDIDKNEKLLEFLEDPEEYFNYFDELYRRNESTIAVGDITPSYSMLDANGYGYIRRGLESRGFHIKVIFIMRDPVERIWSMIHQKAKVMKALQSSEQHPASSVTISSFMHDQASRRTRYDRIIQELEKVFSRDDIFYEFYERYFNPEYYENLGKYLGMSLNDPDFSLRRNSSYMKESIRQEMAEEVAAHYHETYLYILERFGINMKNLWAGYKYLNL